MKLSTLQQSYMNRRSASFRGSSAPLDSSTDNTIKSPAAIFWLLLHGFCCLISLVLGFRFSRLVFFFLFSTSTTTTLYMATPFPHLTKTNNNINDLPLEIPVINRTLSSSSRVVVGRHGIRIRPWPHPNPSEVMKAHQIIETVQREQRTQFGVKSPRTLIVVTPTYVRTFQTLHLTGVMHSLMLVPYDVVWIVVEAGGATNETASIIAKSSIKTLHIGFTQKMPNSWEGRHKLETKMRLRALRVVREEMMDGIVMFADDSNMHSMELFDEIQNVKWFGAVSVGILVRSGGGGGVGESSSAVAEKDVKPNLSNPSMPVQGPACNASNKLVGWHTFNSLPYEGKSAVYIDDRATVLPRKLEWAGFVLNSRLLLKEAQDKPEWVKDLDLLDENIESPLALLKDPSMVEPLGSCGRQVLLWWLRVEARADSKFPPGWVIDPPLEITVPSKRTPWPDAPPELPSNKKLTINQEQIIKRSPKTRSPRSKRRSKRKHEANLVETQVSTRHSEQN
ncbi:PREDICTED: probable beta-1,4-xylosyltransferase IRX14 [Populus euphratica]|uniref:Glycosyltransferases n=1 Tax=Populus euphratica TaxID=75702 RepID=A0AAJ6TCQ8_POPEU|nr:PREDICTED: probable beta-1,4-xylosyltransferase IRX14 [Populus euphratica]XP_011008781.1 PREDICTED: probable beta-1,4-xylosyltransferase IRX14 [Populus euphratica]